MVRHFQHIGPIHPTQYLHDDDDLLVNVCVGRVLQKPISRVIYAIYTIQWGDGGRGTVMLAYICAIFELFRYCEIYVIYKNHEMSEI